MSQSPSPGLPAGKHDPIRCVAAHRRAREGGVNPLLYWLVRLVLQPLFHIYFRLSRIGREHIPADGPIIFAANHRSFLDPFVIATLVRRPIYYVAKRELFRHPLVGWLLNSLGAFPVDRGGSDAETIATARAILERGDCVLIFPEGTRTRPGALGPARRGVGRLALETGAPVVPLAVIGTERVRRGWRIRPHKIRIRIGGPLSFPRVQRASPALARAVTDRIWPCVMLQWEWLGGVAPLRRAAVVGSGAWAAALTELLGTSNLDIDLLDPNSANGHGLAGCDLVCLALPAADLPATLGALGNAISQEAIVLVRSEGLVAPLGTLPCAYVAERVRARAVACLGGPGDAEETLHGGAAPVVAAVDAGVARELSELLRRAGLRAERSSDVTGVELAGCASHAAAMAVGVTLSAGAGPAGVAAGRILAEVQDLAARQGGRPESFTGLAGSGRLVAAIERVDGVPAEPASVTDARETVELLARRLRAEGVAAPAVQALAGLVGGRVEPEQWTRQLLDGTGTKRAA